MSETEQGTARSAESGTVNAADLSNDDLAQLVNEGTIPDREEEPEPEKESEQQDPLADSDDDEGEETDDTEEEEAESEESDETDVPGEEETPEPDEHQIRLNEANATAKHFETVAGRLGGKLGFIEGQNKTLADQVTQLQSVVQRIQAGQAAGEVPEFTEPVNQPVAPAPAPLAAPAVDQNAIYHSANAIQQSLASFVQANPESGTIENGQFKSDPAFAKELQERGTDLLNLAQSGDAPTAQQVSGHIYAEAWSKVRRDRAVAAREDMERRTTDQAATLKKKKRAQASAATSTKRASPRRRKVSTPSDLKTDELRNLIDSRAGLE